MGGGLCGQMGEVWNVFWVNFSETGNWKMKLPLMWFKCKLFAFVVLFIIIFFVNSFDIYFNWNWVNSIEGKTQQPINGHDECHAFGEQNVVSYKSSNGFFIKFLKLEKKLMKLFLNILDVKVTSCIN